ncbi:MAG: ABC transporter permease [Bryobacteraceae bacterium]
MIRYATVRLLRGLLVLFGVSLFSFVLFELAPADFFSDARLHMRLNEETIAALRSQYALDRDAFSKYVYWIGSVVRGEWGYSLAYNTPAAPLLWARAQNTLLLTVTATILAWLIAVPLGIWSAATESGLNRLVIRSGVSLLMAVPDLLVILVLILAAAHTAILPLGGMSSLEQPQMGVWSTVQDVASHLALPVTALVLSSLPVIVTHTQSAMAEVLASSFIKAARASGIPRARLLYRHALPAAANPLVSLFGFSVGTLLSSSLLVEAAVGWPGIGRLLLEATLQRDVYVVIGVVMLSAMFLVAGNFVADLLLYWADPRIRRE